MSADPPQALTGLYKCSLHGKDRKKIFAMQIFYPTNLRFNTKALHNPLSLSPLQITAPDNKFSPRT